MKYFCLIVCILAFCVGPSAFSEESPFYISTSYKNFLSNPEQTGMLDTIMIEAFSRIGMDAEIVFTPTERSLIDVNAGLLDGEINRIEGMENNFPNLVRVPEPNMTMHFVAFSKQPFNINGWNSIRDLYIGIVKGWKILENNTRGFPHLTFTPTETELFRMLDKDRLDIALYAKLTGYAAINQMGLEEIFHLDPPLASKNMYLYVHKKHKDLVPRIAAALRSMKEDGTYEGIVEETTRSILRAEH